MVFFLSFLPLRIWGVVSFSILFHFWWFSVPNALIERVQILFGHQNKWSPPFRFGLPWVLKCYDCNSIVIQFTSKEQLKDLTHMICLRIPFYKLYRKNLFSHVLTLKYMWHFKMNSKKFNLKAKHKIKN